MAERTSRRATGVVAAYWSAASSGRFFTWWSAAASFAVASIILVPVQDGGGAAAYGRSVVAAAIGWMILAVPVAGVAMLERRLSGALARGVLITITLVAISVARTFVNSAVLSATFGDVSTGPIVTRILTNLLAAFALFPVVAIITEGRRRTRAIAERLTAALDRLDAATAVAADRARDATAFVTRTAREIRAGRDATLALDARRSVREEEERSTRELARAAAAFAVASARAPELLRHAASTLHGRVQGRCVIFAALADEHPPTADDIARFRDETDTALDELLPAHDTPPTGGFDRMLAGWRPLMDLDTRIADAAASAIAQAGDGSVLTEVVNEALVNAVKHSGARAARIEITMGDSGEMFVRVAAPGRLPRAVMQTRSFTGWTLLFQDGDDVVLEAAVPATGVTVNA